MSRELLAEAIREEKQPRVCLFHEKAVVYDEFGCPCCRIIREFPKLLSDQELKMQKSLTKRKKGGRK